MSFGILFTAMDENGNNTNGDCIPDTTTTLMEALSRAGGAPDAAWERFARLYAPVVRRYVAILRRSWPSLPVGCEDDIIQDTFLALVRDSPERRWDPARGRFRDYLFGIVRNKARTFIRRESRNPQTFEEAALDMLPCDETAAADVETAAIRAELWRALVERVFAETRMSETSKAVFMKLVADGIPVEQLCAEYDMTPNAIYRLRNRMAGKLREKWLSLGGDGTDLYDALELLARDLAR